MLGLSGLLGRRPDSLSGGERQRVAIGRAIAWGPRVLLLDEPFSSLDAPLRASLRDEILDLHRRLGMTLIHVTHDQGEALAIGDRVAILDRGRMLQCDTPRQIYQRPAHRFIGEFVGNPPMNIVPCEVVRNPDRLAVYLESDGPTSIEIGDESEISFKTLGVGERIKLDLGIRPEDVEVVRMITEEAKRSDQTTLLAKVARVEYQGHEVWLHLWVGGRILKSRGPSRTPPREGEDVQLRIRFDAASWFDRESGARFIGVEKPFAEVQTGC
jgi:ABC-type sugar transport system ATPase subunit